MRKRRLITGDHDVQNMDLLIILSFILHGWVAVAFLGDTSAGEQRISESESMNLYGFSALGMVLYWYGCPCANKGCFRVEQGEAVVLRVLLGNEKGVSFYN